MRTIYRPDSEHLGTKWSPRRPPTAPTCSIIVIFPATMLSQPKSLHFSQSPVFLDLPKTSPKNVLNNPSQQKSRSDLPQPDLESYSVTMHALGEAAARRHGSEAEAEAEGWRQALQLLEELRERRLSATTRMLGGKHPRKTRGCWAASFMDAVWMVWIFWMGHSSINGGFYWTHRLKLMFQAENPWESSRNEGFSDCHCLIIGCLTDSTQSCGKPNAINHPQ